MRICYLADGRYVHARRWMAFFKNRGHEMHLVSFAPLNSEHVEALASVGIRYHGSIGAFHLKRWWLTLHDLRLLKGVLSREKIQILHSHYLGANAWYAALTGFRPLVLTIMGGGDVTGPDWRPSGRRERLLTPYALRKADLVTSWSQTMADAVRPYCRADVPIETVHGGVDLTRFYPGPASDGLREKLALTADMKVVFSPRLMRPLSNITTIARAAGEVCNKVPNTAFLFAAPVEEQDREYENQVKEILRAAGIEKQARFIGAIPHQEIAEYHRLADLTISIPSTDGTPMTVLESMACRTPVVCGDIPDYDRRYFENGKTVLAANVADSNSVAAALITLLQERDLASQLATEAHRRVWQWGSYEAQMTHMEHLYYRLMDSSPAAV